VCSCLSSMIGVLAVRCRRKITPRSISTIIATPAWVPSAEAYVMAAVRADSADAKDLNPSGLLRPKSPVLWSRMPDCGVPDRCPAGQRRRLFYL
jgi:hypothetical protein